MWLAGVPVSQALEVSSRSALNAHYEMDLRKAAWETRSGRMLSESLSGTQMLTGYLLDILRTSEMTGNLGDTVEHFAGILEDEALTMATQEFVAFVIGLNVLGMILVGDVGCWVLDSDKRGRFHHGIRILAG